MGSRRVYLETFGCQMNELDSELVAGQLAALGYELTPEAERAHVILYNTCSVREQAEQKVWSRLGDLVQRKADEPSLVVGVLGCMAERDGEDLMRRMPVVDVMCGPGELDKLPGLLDNALRTKESLCVPLGPSAGSRSNGQGGGSGKPLRSTKLSALQGNTSRRSSTLAAASDDLELLDLSRSISPTDHNASAYVRITRGCNKFCTYCVVPFTRGAEVHRPPMHILDECKKLADAGVREITLLGQTVNHYRFEDDAAESINGVMQPQKGRTYKGSHHRDAFAGERVTTFANLLYQIHEQVPGVERLRFVTSYPKDFGDDVLEVIRDCPRICRYLHVPGQSGSDRVLKRMNRGYTVGEYMEFLDRARAILDEPEKNRPLMISGDIIVGFSGETDEDFEQTIDLVKRARYKNCFIFKYSPRPGTVAYDKIPDDVPETIKRRRNNELLAVQAEISDAISQEQVGRTFDVFVEGLSKHELRSQGFTKSDIRKHNAVSLTVSARSEREDQSDDGCSGVATAPEQSVQLCGRTDTDLIVFFDSPTGVNPDALLGRTLHVSIDRADRLSLFGTLLTS